MKSVPYTYKFSAAPAQMKICRRCGKGKIRSPSPPLETNSNLSYQGRQCGRPKN